ncbi:MAG: UDP-N-acetylmuramate dehydrogenase [Patescibacteria group bacterium]|jgi:UDP-N-acetylmuramate dehydrogenase|nr:UDP-N-acetylmuramate dehydrogenase [Patescibacteria group bacterium]
MALNITYDQPLANHTTMKLGGNAKYFVEITNEDELIQAVEFAKSKNSSIITIGDGSNTIFKDGGFDGLVIHNCIKGMEVDQNGMVSAKAGVNWDELVKQTADKNLAGIEALSLIPGTVGGAPVNNIGAYGQEVSQSIVEITAFDTKRSAFLDLTNVECQFGYRSSIFKNSLHGRFIITQIKLQLTVANNYQPPNYGSLTTALDDQKLTNPSVNDVRNVVCHIRESKLPDPKNIPNCGSFFKNPIVPKALCEALVNSYPDMPYFNNPKGYKLAAAWLIDKAGLKGYSKDGIRIYEKQALVLVNDGTRSFKALENMYKFIQDKVNEKFGVSLEPEPEIIE